jgi:hypothetical protein
MCVQFAADYTVAIVRCGVVSDAVTIRVQTTTTLSQLDRPCRGGLALPEGTQPPSRPSPGGKHLASL